MTADLTTNWLFYIASALPENVTFEDLNPVMDELKIVEELLPAYAPNIHDALDFMGVIWVVETARAKASSMPEPSVTPGPTATHQPLPTAVVSQPGSITDSEQNLVILMATSVIGLIIVGYLAWKRTRGSPNK